MTGDLRSAGGSGPGTRLTVDRPDTPDPESPMTAVGDEMAFAEVDPEHAAQMPDPLDERIAAAAKALFFARDLVRPGPGVLPFGARARARRERRRQVDATAAARRSELNRLLCERRHTRGAPTRVSVRRGRPRLVATLLTTVVIATAVAGWWMTQRSVPAPTTADSNDTSVAATDLPNYITDATGSADTTATTPKNEPPLASPDLTSPEAAAASWMAAWCPIDHNRNPDAAAAKTRAAMTVAGWAQFTATPEHALASGIPGLTATCDAPQARIVSRPSGADRLVVVGVSATRTVTNAEHAGPRRFRIERRQDVVRGEDGFWRVDVTAVGG